MSGIRTSARRMEPLKRKAAIIQPRLRVRILPVDSKVESSNMACLRRLPFSRAGREAKAFGAHGGLAPRWRALGATNRDQGTAPPLPRFSIGLGRNLSFSKANFARGSRLSFIPIGTTVLV